MNINNDIVKKVNEYYTFCKAKHQAHIKAAEHFNKLYISTTAPTIVVSAITTIFASYNGMPNFQWLAIVVAILSGITTVLQALVSFFEFKNKYQEHMNTAIKYVKLLRDIEGDFYVNFYSNEFAANPNLTDNYIRTFFVKMQTEFVNIQSSAPVLPSFISDANYANAHFGVSEVDDVLIEIPPRQPLTQ
jgi:hypothetical protein